MTTKLALAGAGPAATLHGLAVAGVPGLRVVRLAPADAAGAHRRAGLTAPVAGDYEDLPGGADAVVVATPPALRLREARRALDASAAVLVEAPLAANLAAADRLVAAAGEPDAVVAYGENLVHAPVVAEAVGARRRMGDLTYLDVRLTQGPAERDDARPPDWGGGVLFDPGAHAVALALLLAAPDRVVEVAAAEIAAGDGMDVDDDARVTLAFASGLRATVRVTWRAAASMWEAQAASASGAVRLELVPEASVELNGVPLRLADPPPGLASPRLHQLGHVAQLAALAADAEARRPPRCSATFGRVVLDVVCAAYAAAASGRPQPVPFRGPRERTPAELWRDGHNA